MHSSRGAPVFFRGRNRAPEGERWTSAPAGALIGRPARNQPEELATNTAGTCRVTESDLAERCRTGDRRAQRELYDQTSERIYRLLLRMTQNHEAALDLAQDTYLRAFSRIGQFDGKSSLATWLYRIAVNEALQFLRRKKPIELTHRAENEFSTGDEGGKSDVRLDLNEALRQMGAEDQAILLLRYQEGLDYRAIAAILDCPAGTVASRLSRVRHALRELLAGGYEGLEGNQANPHPISGQGKGSIPAPLPTRWV